VSDASEGNLHPLVGGFADAENYDYARPRYGAAVVAALKDALDLRAGSPVLELGAGTGQLSEALVAAGLDLTAVEPLPRTRAILARAIGSERVREGVAEEIPLPDRSVEAVFAADSFHWFDPSRAMPEIRRVLRPGGGVAVLRSLPLWEGRWIEEIGSLLDEARPAHPAYPPFEGRAAAALSDQQLYGPTREITVHSDQITDPARILAYLASFSWIGSLATAERDGLLHRAGEVLARHEVGVLRHRIAHIILIARLR
jgi:SAM-dependent methyltransferase